MAVKEPHGVVIVWLGVSPRDSMIHRPDAGGESLTVCGSGAMKSGNWELYPNLETAKK